MMHGVSLCYRMVNLVCSLNMMIFLIKFLFFPLSLNRVVALLWNKVEGQSAN